MEKQEDKNQGVSSTLVPDTEVKKKRGRPSKSTSALTATPISSSIPLTGGEFTVQKRGRGRPVGSKSKSKSRSRSIKKPRKEMLGDTGDSFHGSHLMPHTFTVKVGEDVNAKVMSMAQGPVAFVLLSANGVISKATLEQSTSRGGTITFEGCYEILSLSASYAPCEIDEKKNSAVRISISLAGPDGNVIGGKLAGMLIAGCPVQVVAGSFISGQWQKNKKKSRIEAPSQVISSPANGGKTQGFVDGMKPVSTPSFTEDNAASSNPIPVFDNTSDDE